MRKKNFPGVAGTPGKRFFRPLIEISLKGDSIDPLDPTDPEVEVAQKIESKSWIGLVLIAGTLTFLLGGALIVRGMSRKGRY